MLTEDITYRSDIVNGLIFSLSQCISNRIILLVQHI